MSYPLRFAVLFAALGLAPAMAVWAAASLAPAAAAENRATLPHERASTWRVRVRPQRALAPTAISMVTQPFRAASDLISRLEGLASFYWQEQKTASGERFDKTAFTAAHKTLPFNTRVRVTNMNNGRSVVVRINDRGPFVPGRVIDLSDAAAGAIDMRSQGLARVRLEVIE